jgi:hypothetical protein
LCNSSVFGEFFTSGDKRLELEAGGGQLIDLSALSLSTPQSTASADLGVTVTHDLREVHSVHIRKRPRQHALPL